MLEIRLLGQFAVRRDGRSVVLSSHPAQVLLAYLSLHAGRHYSRDYLAGILWPYTSEANAHNNLRQALWHLRHAVGSSCIAADRNFIWLDPDERCWIDANLLKCDENYSTQSLIEAVTVYEGDLLPGFYEDWVTPERDLFQALFDRQMQRLMGSLLAEQRWEAAVQHAERWIALGHIPEPAYRTLMVAHAQLGNMSAMSDAYRRCVEVLHNELGVCPTDETRDLYRQLSSVRHNMPAQMTSFVGRKAELAQVICLLEGPLPRLLTLTGAPGSGKTRLALEAAVAVAKRFQGGICFVPLASVGDPVLVAHTIATALGIKDAHSHQPLETLKYHLCGRRMLLVLDNFEHLMPAAPLVGDLLSVLDDLKILVTSREVLHLSGEQVYSVPPLHLPNLQNYQPLDAVQESEACALFILRAQIVQPAFTLTPTNALSISRLCTRLDGLPLAIELAAARSRFVSPEALLALIEKRLDAFVMDIRNAPPRHRTLRATIEWSYQLLKPDEQTLFNRLAVFVGGGTRETAVAVCSPGLSVNVSTGLEALVAKSLIICEQGPDGEPRFTMLETLREYALERLAESGEMKMVRRWHAESSLAFAEQADKELRGCDRRRWWRRVDAEQGNLREAFEWALSSGNPLLGLKLAGSLERYWWVGHCLAEGTNWIQRALDAAPAAPPAVRAKALRCAGSLAYLHHRPHEGLTWVEEALALYREMGDENNTALTLFIKGLLALIMGDFEQARGCQIEATRLFRELRDMDGIGLTLHLSGILFRYNRDYERARECLEESLACFQLLDARYHIGSVVYEIGHLWLALEEYDRARASFKETMRIGLDEGFTVAVGHAALGLGMEAVMRDDAERAARLMGASEAVLEAIGSPTPLPEYPRYVAAVRDRLGEMVFTSTWAEGRAMTNEQVIAYALESDATMIPEPGN